MAKARLLWKNVTLEAATTVVASTEATGYAATNLKNAKRGLPWRSTTTTGNHTVTVSFSSRTIKAVVLLNVIAHVGGSVKAERNNAGYTVFDGGTGLFVFPSPNRTNLVVLYNPAGVTATDIKITFTNTGGVSQYVQLGGIFIVDSTGYYDAPVNVTDSLDHSQIDPSDERISIGGQAAYNLHPGYLQFVAQFAWMSAAQKDQLAAIRDTVGRSTPFVFAVDPSDQNKTVYARLAAADFKLSHNTRDQWSCGLTLREAL